MAIHKQAAEQKSPYAEQDFVGQTGNKIPSSYVLRKTNGEIPSGNDARS